MTFRQYIPRDSVGRSRAQHSSAIPSDSRDTDREIVRRARSGESVLGNRRKRKGKRRFRRILRSIAAVFASKSELFQRDPPPPGYGSNYPPTDVTPPSDHLERFFDL